MKTKGPSFRETIAEGGPFGVFLRKDFSKELTPVVLYSNTMNQYNNSTKTTRKRSS